MISIWLNLGLDLESYHRVFDVRFLKIQLGNWAGFTCTLNKRIRGYRPYFRQDGWRPVAAGIAAAGTIAAAGNLAEGSDWSRWIEAPERRRRWPPPVTNWSKWTPCCSRIDWCRRRRRRPIYKATRRATMCTVATLAVFFLLGVVA